MEDRKSLFLHELFKYNKNNYEQLHKSTNLDELDINVYKAATSLITRYFIWVQNHPELSEDEVNQMFYILSLDEILQAISEFPQIPVDKLRKLISKLF